MEKVSAYVRGKTLDVGAGNFDRYSASFPQTTEYLRMDTHGADITGSIYEIPFDNNTFDTVVSMQVFEHLARPHEAARELFRVLKPAGYGIITVPQWNELHEEPHDYFRYTKYGLESLFKEAGFKIVQMDHIGGFYSTLAQMRIRFLIDNYKLYERPLLGRIANKLFSLYGRHMIARDKKPSIANSKHTIGWCVVIQK